MSVNHAPQSLPSFAQAFSSSSLSSIPNSNNALPPIQPRTHHTISPSRQPSVEQLRNSRKRSREDVAIRRESTDDSGRQSPRIVRIKEEDDPDDSLIDSPSPPEITSPIVIPPSQKKRRVTVSGTTLPPSTAPSSSEISLSTPITPVVITIPTGEDVQLRSTLKQQLIEQRRPSFAAPPGPSPMLSAAINNGTSSSSATYSPPEGSLAASKLSLPRLGRRSPNTVARLGGNTLASGSRATVQPQPLTPPPMIVPSQQPLSLTANQPEVPLKSPPSNSLPPPPISFARRRAAQSGGRKRKPADIVISPRGTHSSDSLAPVIQSAPPVPELGRFPMAIPRLPTALSGNQTTRRVATNVPPTPTRFGLQHTIGPSVSAPKTATTRSPPAIPIASSLVPPTPRALQHPGYSGDKSAFLAPFEVFYDALNDSKQMKNWLSEQLQKSNTLLQSLQKVDAVVEDLVEKRTRSMQEEMQSMRQRMDSLEEALRAVRADSARNQSSSGSGVGYPQSKFQQNGMSSSGSEPSSSYRFPTTSSEQRRRVSPPSWGTDKDRDRATSPSPDTDRDRRMSASVARLETPRLDQGQPQSQSQTPYSPFAASSSRGGPVVPASNAKGTPPLRSQVVPGPERSNTLRQTQADVARPPGRMYYPGSGAFNGGCGSGSGETARGESHKNPEER
ncbi:uncharacterized protein BJ212DRAFT_1296878 [Suillus subaureus]|uniref:Uncharacterized protein n=1 Tax=Suillus subaureus TaxID=48587 RepID=A0A9P7EJV9_9AGAM|nr:uncharacterized protein BJ212DRAFT_1296878 [Suillus subaureus]KAG1822956.1 hypothetical protein BJ212DRAFT_1296878 [Suillus subaureus]